MIQRRSASAKLPADALHHRRLPAARQDGAAPLRHLRGAAADSRLSLPSAAARTSPRTGGSRTCSRSGSRAITTSGARCGPTAWPSASAPATPIRTRSSWRGPRRCRSCLRNPLYHWTHLELRRYFGIDDLLDETTRAGDLEAGERAARRSSDLTAHGILQKFEVRAVCTTDDPADPLDHHAAIRASGLATKVYPTFRPDRALQVDDPEAFNPWVERLGAHGRTSTSAASPDFIDALGEAAPGLPRRRRPPVRSRPAALLRLAVHRARRGGDLRPGASRPGGEPGASTSSSRRT